MTINKVPRTTKKFPVPTPDKTSQAYFAMADRGAKDKQDYTHYVAIDFGTSGTGIALSTAGNPDNIKVFSHWTALKIAIDIKCPTVLLLDPEGKFEAFGEEASTLYYTKRNLKYPDRVAEYYFFNQFKMSLYSREVCLLAYTTPLMAVKFSVNFSAL